MVVVHQKLPLSEALNDAKQGIPIHGHCKTLQIPTHLISTQCVMKHPYQDIYRHTYTALAMLFELSEYVFKGTQQSDFKQRCGNQYHCRRRSKREIKPVELPVFGVDINIETCTLIYRWTLHLLYLLTYNYFPPIFRKLDPVFNELFEEIQ